MPGTLLHLSFAQKVCQHINSPIDKFEFMCGNLIPDETKDKYVSHYRIHYGITGFFVPEIDKAKKDLFFKKDALKLGMYCHLYLDRHFITDFLIPEFEWDYEKMKVTNPRNHKIWDFSDFLSKSGFYSSYTEINHLLIENEYIDMSIVNNIPNILPQTGIPRFDQRRSITWKEELDEYLAQKTTYSGDFLDYDNLCKFLKNTALKFVYEHNL